MNSKTKVYEYNSQQVKELLQRNNKKEQTLRSSILVIMLVAPQIYSWFFLTSQPEFEVMFGLLAFIGISWLVVSEIVFLKNQELAKKLKPYTIIPIALSYTLLFIAIFWN